MAKEKKHNNSKRRVSPGFKLRKKFHNAFKGLVVALREESTLIYYAIITILVIGIGIWVELDSIEWAILLLTIGVLFGIEFLNTAIENFVDLLSFEYNVHAKKIKDICAAASVLNSIMSIAIGAFIFYNPFVARIEDFLK
ncbi:diacylglycerol kinase family protein [Spiroplasma endosymbiont of Aspidapion aeneum]|uniref:diacylglycerol kinase family protein n=1 Tax=Spiroplasma endosymbiont of Aspidapion aeneum TaxID=3066276 RepID=UPI00313C2EF1